uniref:DH domain-containing protein n=1 Tax=Arcella intermedia TaxID=1963864 RepID=A0A6B2LJI4_9EUKA
MKKLNEKPFFTKFIKKAEKKPDCNLHSIHDFLISMVQRIPQYINLLHDLQKNTVDFKEKDQIIVAHHQLKGLADSINKLKKEREDYKQLRRIHLQCGIKECPDKRKYIYEETVYSSKEKSENPETKYYKIFVFSDELWLVKFKGNFAVRVKRYPTSIPISFPSEHSIKLAKTTYYLTNSVKLTNLLNVLRPRNE